jgi:hypothetical protein
MIDYRLVSRIFSVVDGRYVVSVVAALESNPRQGTIVRFRECGFLLEAEELREVLDNPVRRDVEAIGGEIVAEEVTG